MADKINMRQFGLSKQQESHIMESNDRTIARVLSQEKGMYRLVSEHGEKSGEISGRFHYEVQAKSEYPAVGDFVLTDWNEQGIMQ